MEWNYFAFSIKQTYYNCTNREIDPTNFNKFEQIKLIIYCDFVSINLNIDTYIFDLEFFHVGTM